jgi:formylglycine-generating enzyme required for sulfatase activity
VWDSVAATTGQAKSEWWNACVGRTRLDYPYGATYEAGTCNISDPSGGFDGGTVRPVGDFPKCANGADAGVVDSLGNVAEWENACRDGSDAGPDGSSQYVGCRVRGGAAFDNPGVPPPTADLRCDFDFGDTRIAQRTNLGFRCCAPPP